MTRAPLDALFVDRDGTLIVDRNFLSDPKGVRLISGAARELLAFTSEGTRLFVITNQSGIARGLLTWEQVHAVNAEVEKRLRKRGVFITEFLICPHYPGGSVPQYSISCPCRKPGTLLHEEAISRHGLNPKRCAIIGDKWDDVGAAVLLGMPAVHVLTGFGREHRPRVVANAPQTLLAGSLASGLRKLRDFMKEK